MKYISSFYEHFYANIQELVAEIPQIEAKMRNLQTTAQEIASEISDPIERSAFLKEVTDMEERLSKLKAQAADKSKQLSTAVELQQNFDVTIANLSKWLDRAEPLINQELVLNNPVKVRTQLREYKASTVRKIHRGCTGPLSAWKHWKFIIAFSRHWKPWKTVLLLVRVLKSPWISLFWQII